MDSVYENTDFKLSTVSSDEKCSQYKGNQVTSSKRTKVLLIVLGVSLVLALGGLSVLGFMYVNVSMQLSAQETNSTKSPECSNGQAYACQLTVSNGRTWGIWGFKDMCPSGMFASGFSLKVQRSIGAGDDTALNGIRLHCVGLSKGPSDSQENTTIESGVGNWGEWTDIHWCHSGVLKSFQLRVESPQGDRDDTAANNIRFTCTGGDVLEGNGTNWGNWGNRSPKCLGKGICGIQTRVEPPQGSGDDTALNDVRMFCCD